MNIFKIVNFFKTDTAGRSNKVQKPVNTNDSHIRPDRVEISAEAKTKFESEKLKLMGVDRQLFDQVMKSFKEIDITSRIEKLLGLKAVVKKGEYDFNNEDILRKTADLVQPFL